MTVCLSDRRVGYLKNDAGNSSREGMFLQRLIDTFRPRVLLSNASASASWNSSSVLQRANDAHLCRERGIHVVAEITETAGLVAAGIHAAPFEHADVVIAGTHGSLRGPNGTLIFTRKTKAVLGARYDEETGLPVAVERSVFPGHQGGPHNHTIAAVITALKQVLMPTFQVYQRQALANADALADRLRCLGYRLRGITEDEAPHSHHLVVRVLVGQDAATAADVANLLRLTLEVIGVEVGHLVVVAEDEVQLHLGTLAMSSRQWFREDFRWVADIIHEAISISKASEHQLDDPHIHELRREVLIKMQSNKLGSAE